MRILPAILLLLSAVLFACCNDDDHDWYANYQMDFLDILTNADGQGTRAVTDAGDTLTLLSTLKGLAADTAYRYVAVFVKENGGIRFSSAVEALAPHPFSAGRITMKTDSVKMQSIWKVGRYINITLNILAKNKAHIFGFEQTSFDEENGHKHLRITLYHNRNQDVEAFTRTSYLSLPLWCYSDAMEQGRDSVHIAVNEYGNGPTTYSFAY